MSVKSNQIPYLIIGKGHNDQRGRMTFINDFDMTLVRRQYQISPISTFHIRAWQGHAVEKKWFQVVLGKFLVRLIPLAEMQEKISLPKIYEFILSVEDNSVLFIPEGFANGFQALEEDSSLMVYSDKKLKEATSDDYRFPSDYEAYWKTNII